MDDDDGSPDPAKALRQRRPQDFFAAKICFSFRWGKNSLNNLKNLASL